MGNRKLWLASINGALHSEPLKHKNPATGCEDQVTQSATPEESVRLIRMAHVEDDAITGLQWPFELQRDSFTLQPAHLPEINPALFAEPGMDQLLVVVPAKPAGVQSAGKRHLQIIPRVARRNSRVACATHRRFDLFKRYPLFPAARFRNQPVPKIL